MQAMQLTRLFSSSCTDEEHVEELRRIGYWKPRRRGALMLHNLQVLME